MRKLSTFAVLAAALGTSGCASMLESNPPLYPVDFKERFPIQLGNAAQKLEIYPTQHAGLESGQRRALIDYAREYKRAGQSIVAVAVPTGPDGRITKTNATNARRVLDVLHANGISRANVHGETYLPPNPNGLNPIKMTYLKPTATVAAKCGLWTDDVGFGSLGTDVENLPYYNHGCATQSAVANQIADPMDVVRHQQVSPGDAARSTTVLTAWRGRTGTGDSSASQSQSSSSSSSNAR